MISIAGAITTNSEQGSRGSYRATYDVVKYSSIPFKAWSWDSLSTAYAPKDEICYIEGSP